MGLRRISRKRGSLNLSINAIVVLILAITMLGLGLGFINKLFGGATDNIGDQITAINDQDQKRLEQDGITQLSKGNIEMGKKESKQLVLAVKNDEGSQLDFTVDVECWDESGGKCWAGLPQNAEPDSSSVDRLHVKSAIGINTEGGTFGGTRGIAKETLKTFPLVVTTRPGIEAGVYSIDVRVTVDNGGGPEVKVLPLVVSVS